VPQSTKRVEQLPTEFRTNALEIEKNLCSVISVMIFFSFATRESYNRSKLKALQQIQIDCIIIIRPHRSTSEMRSIVTDRVAWSVCQSVGLSVCHSSEPCKHGWTDRDNVWAEDSGGSKEPCIHNPIVQSFTLQTGLAVSRVWNKFTVTSVWHRDSCGWWTDSHIFRQKSVGLKSRPADF